MKINKTKIIILFLHIASIFFAYFAMQNCINYREISIVGSLFVGLAIVYNIIYEKKLFSASIAILLCFILFQFGLPFLTAIDSKFESWYINQFSLSNLILSVKITVICIQFFALGLIITAKKNNEKGKITQKNTILMDNNSKNIYIISKYLYLICAIVAIPLALYVVYLALKNGYSYIKDDNMNIYNALTRFVQQMIIPANLLLIIYSNTNKTKKLWIRLLIAYSVLLLFTGARTTSLGVFLVLILLKKDTVDLKSNRSIFNKILPIFWGVLLLFIGVFIAKYRYDGSITKFSIKGIFESVIEEMGFNFTSLPFTRLFVPKTVNYKYGMSYIYSIICLIPRSLDPVGFIDKLHNMLPETWLANSLNDKFGNLYKFGVGYSVIAEAYYNFGKFAFISIFIQGLIIGLFINRFDDKNKFAIYIKYIMLFSLMTYPRRTFITLLKSIEYCVVLVIILIWCFSKKKGKFKNENIDNLS